MALTAAQKKAKELANEINKIMGPGSVQLGNDSDFTVTYLPTGVRPVDHLLQGGLPRGRFTEIFGDYSTLKSYVGYKAIATTQAAGGVCALVDTEHAYDEDWARELGVDTEALLVKRPETGEEAMDIVEIWLRAKVDLVVFDSVAATAPKAEVNTQLGGDKNIQPARLAALMSVALRKLTAANSKTAMLWINQTRINVGVMFGSPEAVPGGKSLPFYASYRVAFRKAGKETRDADSFDGDKKVKVKETTSQKIRATVEKSKLNKPYREIYFKFNLINAEVDDLDFLFNLCVENGSLQTDGKSGNWWVKGSTKKVRGLKRFRESLTVEQLDRLAFPGKYPPAKKRVVLAKPSTSKKKVIVGTRTRGRAR